MNFPFQLVKHVIKLRKWITVFDEWKAKLSQNFMS